jgi:Tol biopolymer transport system component
MESAMKSLRGFSVLFVLGFCPLLCLATDHVVFARLAPAETTLYIANADGSGEHAVTQGSLNYNPVWSPAGDWIAFTSERKGSADLYRMHPDGSGEERLTDSPSFDDQAAFSPDEKQIVFVSTRAAGFANLWILNVTTHAAKPLTSGHGGDFRPAWSPDGNWIAFSSDRESDLPLAKGRWERLQPVDVYIVHPDGSGLKRITQHGDFCGSPKWAADSKSVVAYCMTAQETWSNRAWEGVANDKLMRIDIANGAATPVAAGPGVKFAHSILASGDIAYLRHDKTANGLFYASGKQGPSGKDIGPPSWSPDGARVVYSRSVLDRSAIPHKLWSPNKNFDLAWTGALPAYDPTGADLAVTRIDPDGNTTLLVFDEAGKSRTLLHQPGLILGPQWSADGRRVIFGVGQFSAFLDFDIGEKKPIDPVNGGAQVGIVNADGTDFHVITAGPNNNAFPSFAPDGKHIVYRTSGPGEDGLRIMNLDDKTIVKLTNEWDNFPIWSPSGELIAFVRRVGTDFAVFTIHPDGRDLQQLTNIHGNEAHLAWSPDGKRLLFTSSRMGFKDETQYTGAPQPYGEIFVMNSDGTHVEQLTDDQWEEGVPAWQPHRAQSAAGTN